MKISTKGKYSVTALYELAQHYGEGAVCLKTIAQNQGISEPYLEQLMGTLRRAGFVRSVRGAQGGYMLAKSPHDITIGDIITTMEGPIALVDCLLNSEGEENPCCEKAVHCMTRDVWAKVCEGLSNVLNAITLADLCHKDEKGETAK